MSKSGVIAKVSATVLVCGGTALADNGGSAPLDPFAFVQNPITIRMANGQKQTNCADPTVIRGQGADKNWYAYCTTDSLNDQDVDANGNRRSHLIPMLKSSDLVTWDYMGDAFSSQPSWVAPGAGLWAPEITYKNGLYHLYYVGTDIVDSVSGVPGCNSDNAIGVATSTSPLGPWTDKGSPVVGPRPNGGGCNFFWTYDPEVLTTSEGEDVIYYGSYYGGIEARALSEDGLTSDPASATPIAIGNRYEGANVVEKDGEYWLFASASNCCNGPLTGYQVFAGRSDSPYGPFVDKEGDSFLEGRVGGTPVITINGNPWVGTGHNSVFQDAGGNWYTAFHGIDDTDPYFEGNVGYTHRPLLIDRLTWDREDGWPTVRNGLMASTRPQLAPLAQQPKNPQATALGRSLVNTILDATDPDAYLRLLDDVDTDALPKVASASDEMNGAALAPQWSWVRPPTAPGAYAMENGAFRFATQAAELYVDDNTASVLTENAPAGNWIAETKFSLDLPPNGCCFNYVQAGMVVYANDDAYVRLAHVSIWETRQIEFGKEIAIAEPGYPRYGSAVGSAPGETTWLRIVKIARNGSEKYISYSSHDGENFERGAIWEHELGTNAKIGLIALGGSGFNARFDHVRVWKLPTF